MSEPDKLSEVEAWVKSHSEGLLMTALPLFQQLKSGAFSSGGAPNVAVTLVEIIYAMVEAKNDAPPCLLNALFMANKTRYPTKPAVELVGEVLKATSLAQFAMTACSKPIVQRIISNSARLSQLTSAFNESFRGDTPEDLKTAMAGYSELYDESKYYGRCVSIVQSSATGKSRLIKEFGKKNLTLTICFRSDEDPRAGYPTGDLDPYNYFHQKGVAQRDRFMGEELAAAFFGSLFSEMAKSIGKAIAGNPTANFVDGLAAWQDPDSRRKHFKAVVKDAMSRLNDSRKWLSEKNSWIGLHKSCGNSFPSPLSASESSIPGWCSLLFNELCFEGSNALRMLLGNQPVYVAIDECLGLEEWKYGKPPDRCMTVLALQRIIKHCESFPNFWVFLLDTSSSILELVPYGLDAKSMRLSRDCSMLPPYVYIGFNLVACETLRPLTTAADALELSRFKQYGRPYWSTLSDCEVLGAADEKLFFDPQFSIYNDRSFNVSKQNHVFAAFANTVGLEIGHSEQSTMLAADAVSSHLRILVGVVNGVLVTQAPSEPILSLVSLQALQSNFTSALNTFLKELLIKGLVIERGQKGELFCRVICILSRALATSQLILNNSVVAIHRAEWLCKMLNLQGNEVDDPDCSLAALLDTNEPAYINFTHVVQMSTSLADISIDVLVKAWEGHYMFQCMFQEPVVDGLWPEYRGNLHDPFDPTKMAYGVYQSKLMNEPSHSSVGDELTGPYITRTCSDGTIDRFKPQHVALLIELGTVRKFRSKGEKTICLTHRSATIPTFPTKPMPLPHLQALRKKFYADLEKGETEPKRHCFVIRGYRGKQYPILEGLDKEMESMVRFTVPSLFPEFEEKYRRQMDPNLIEFRGLRKEDIQVSDPNAMVVS